MSRTINHEEADISVDLDAYVRFPYVERFDDANLETEMHHRSAWETEELSLLRTTCRRFYAEHCVPHRERFEQQHHVDRDLWNKAGELGLLCCSIPEEYGGGGGTFASDLVVLEEQARTLDSGWGNAVHSGIVAHYLLAYGTEAQKHEWLPQLASGTAVAAISMTEPGAGSDLQAIQTKAVRDGDSYVISGAKTFVTNGSSADLVVVAAKTDPTLGAKGISLFLVDARTSEGFVRGRVLEKIGQHGADTSELFFDDVVVPASNMLGPEGAGFAQLMGQLPQERLVTGVMVATSTQEVVDLTVEYTKDRKAFGGSLFDLQNTRFQLAQCATDARVGRVFVDHCVERHLRGELTTTDASMIKLWMAETYGKVVDTCLQLFGGYGYMREYPVARAYEDARITRIYAGASEVMKELIARSL